jgi:deoxyadenosine/deoxycytidine kinase|tara:strand:+ start:1313 stop:1990 length:678 start_codon:yes stop_codon:yes gene_type:complete
MQQATDKAIVLSAAPRHNFVAVEGPIGVGKTTLCKKLANTFNYHTLLENADNNPFLERFYNNENVGLATQLYFLFQRSKQLAELHQNDMFDPRRVADFLIEKDKLFAQANLDADEYDLYQQVYHELQPKSVRPDLVIYLQAPVDTLIKRIIKRGIIAEKYINRDYLEQLNEAYSQFFLYYDGAPLLIINATDIDFADNDQHYQQLLSYIQGITSGRHYFNPAIAV